IVYHLVFVRDRSLAILRHEILHAAVGAGRDAPFESQIEVVEDVRGDDVAAVGRGLASAREMLEGMRLDDPPARGECRALEPAPAARGLAIEEKAPSLRAFGRAERRAGGSRCLREKG